MNTEHPDFDALSAHLDGEAPEWEAHVGGCDACAATLARLRTVSALVAGPPPAIAASSRERAIARALGESSPEITERPMTVPVLRPVRPEPLSPARSGSSPTFSPSSPSTSSPSPSSPLRRRGGGSGLWVGVGSAAAVLVAFVAIGLGVLSGGGGSDDGATVAAGGPPSQERTSSPTGGTGNGLAEGVVGDSSALTADGPVGGVDGGDLGELPDSASLVARAAPTLAGTDDQIGAAPGAGATTGAPLEGGGSSSRSDTPLVPKVAGTRPCEMEARASRTGLGTVVYFAVGRVAGAPVVVLGFSPGSAPGPVTLLALDQQQGCRIVLEAVSP